MDPFYYIVSGVTVILLIILLTSIGVLMSKPNTAELYPPNNLTCPDYWTLDTDGKTCMWSTSGPNQPKNTLNSQKGASDSVWGGNDAANQKIDFTNSAWNNDKCKYQAFAKTYEVTWDGISNYNGCS